MGESHESEEISVVAPFQEQRRLSNCNSFNAIEDGISASWKNLLDNGFLVMRQVLPAEMLSRALDLSLELLSTDPSCGGAEVRSLGSIGKVEKSPKLAALGFDENLVRPLRNLFMSGLTYHSGIVFNKPPESPATFWHQDYFGWNDPAALLPETTHLMVLCYLVETTPENGCFRVIPGSHRRHHELHDRWLAPDAGSLRELTLKLRRHDRENDWAFRSYAEEVALPAQPGDIIIIDSRLFHGAYANRTQEHRPLLSFSYFVNFERLSAPFCQSVAEEVAKTTSDWPVWLKALGGPMLPEFKGNGVLSARDYCARLSKDHQ